MRPIDEIKLKRLNKILSKRFERQLTRAELEQAYYLLMNFASGLVQLDTVNYEKDYSLPVENEEEKSV